MKSIFFHRGFLFIIIILNLYYRTKNVFVSTFKKFILFWCITSLNSKSLIFWRNSTFIIWNMKAGFTRQSNGSSNSHHFTYNIQGGLLFPPTVRSLTLLHYRSFLNNLTVMSTLGISCNFEWDSKWNVVLRLCDSSWNLKLDVILTDVSSF